MSAEITYHRLKTGWLFGVAAAFVIFAVVGIYSARMTNDYPSYDQGRADARKDTLAKVQKTENDLLYPADDKGNPTAKWVDQDKGLIAIPIDQAMTLEVADLKKIPVGQGIEIPTSAPAPASTNAAPAPAAPAATNAAPAEPTAPAKNAKPAAAKNAPAKPDAQKKKAPANPSPAASTAAPNAATPPAANKESN